MLFSVRVTRREVGEENRVTSTVDVEAADEKDAVAKALAKAKADDSKSDILKFESNSYKALWLCLVNEEA